MSSDGLTGSHFVACEPVPSRGATFHAVDPTTGTNLGPAFADADAAVVANACEAARSAEDAFAAVDGAGRLPLA